MLGGVTYRHVTWLRNHEQTQRKVGRPSEGCPCYYVHCLTCKSSLALNGRNQNNMPVSFACRRTSWLQSRVRMRGEEKQQVNGKRRKYSSREEVGRSLHQNVQALADLSPRMWNKHVQFSKVHTTFAPTCCSNFQLVPSKSSHKCINWHDSGGQAAC